MIRPGGLHRADVESRAPMVPRPVPSRPARLLTEPGPPVQPRDLMTRDFAAEVPATT